jgi:FkbM family methyltransferase
MPVYRYGYEATTAALLEALTDPETVFFDIGSNWGFFSFLIASNPAFRGKVFAFEPNPVARLDLEKILRATDLSQFIFPQPFGLGAKATAMGIAASALVRTGNTHLLNLADGDMSVEVKRLDELNLPLPDVIKLDVEGMELDVLEGSLELLRRARPAIVFESLSSPDDPTSSGRLFNFLAELGYEFFVPVFYFKNKDGPLAVQSDPACAALWDKGVRGELGLIASAPKNRPIMQTHLNLFACHRDRLAALLKRIPLIG